VNTLFIVELDFFLENRLGVSEGPDMISLTKVGNSPLEIVEGLLDLAFGFRRSLGRIDQADFQTPESALKLDFSFIQAESISNMDTVMFDEAKDFVLVHIISQGPSILLDRLTGCFQVGIGPFLFNQLGPDKKPRVVVLGQDHMLETVQGGDPAVLGSVVLKKIPRPRRFEPDKDFFLLFRPGVIITVSQGKIAECLSIELIAEGFFGFLS
jgi:hypothetical protein